MRTSARYLKPAIPLALTALLGVPLLSRLNSVPPQQPILAPLTEPAAGAPVRAVLLPYVGRTAGADVFRLPLTVNDIHSLASSAEVHLTMANYATAATLLEGWLSIEGTPCRFRTPPGTVLVNNALLAFRRQPSCASPGGVPTGTVQLEIRLDMDTGRVALWTYTPPVAGRLRVVADDETLAVQGQTLSWPPQPLLTRIELLAYTWNVAPSVLWARLITTAVVVLAGLTLLLLWTPAGAHRGTAVAGAVLGTTLVMTGLGLFHAVLFPPLQAPDEPDFALSLAKLKNDEALALDIEALARRTHFERLRHHAERRFREGDIGHPWPQRWNDIDFAATAIEQRSPVTAWWWKAIGVRGAARATEHLWTVRRANAILFGVFCGTAIAILAFARPDGRPAAFILPVLAVPTLPFFASYLSESAIFVSVAAILAACVAALVIGSASRPWMGVPLALALGLVWISGRTVWPLLVAAGGALAGRAITGRRPMPSSVGQTLLFWMPVTIGVAGGAWLAARGGVFEYLDQSLRSRSPTQAEALRTAVALTPVLAAGLLIALAAVEWLTNRFTSFSRLVQRFGWAVAVGMAAWILGGFLVSAFVRFPEAGLLPPVAQPFSAEFAASYSKQVLASFAVPFRLLHHDLHLSTLFWSGMGWIDIVVPVWVLDLVIGATVTMIVWSLMQARADTARALRYLALLLGLTLSLPVYAIGAYSVTSLLYGRYLVGWYLLIVMTVWTAPALSRRPWWPWLVGTMAVHAYYLQSIPARYF
jgi:hypothetical protein